jgi:hypothetical protein
VELRFSSSILKDGRSWKRSHCAEEHEQGNSSNRVYPILHNHHPKGNENLQGCIDYKKIWFGSSIKADGAVFDKAIAAQVDLVWSKRTKRVHQSEPPPANEIQCASIGKSTAKGLRFRPPQLMKRARRRVVCADSYTALMLACWGLSVTEIFSEPPKRRATLFPRFSYKG